MKKLFWFLILSVLLGSTVISCKEEKENDTTETSTGEGSLIFQKNEYQVPNFDLIKYDEYSDDDYLGLEMVFYTSDMKYDYGDNWHYGLGNAVRIDLISPSLNGLEPGIYNFDTTYSYSYGNGAVPNSIHWGNVQVGSELYEEELLCGTAEVSISEEIYTIKYSLIMESNDTIAGTYKGEMNYISHR